MELDMSLAGSDGRQVHYKGVTSLGFQRGKRIYHSNSMSDAVWSQRQRHQRSRLDTPLKIHERRMSSRTPFWQRHPTRVQQSQDREQEQEQEQGRRLGHENVTSSNNILATSGIVASTRVITPNGSRKTGDEQLLHPSALPKQIWTENTKNRRISGSSSGTFWSIEATTSIAAVSTRSTLADFTFLPFDVLQRIAGSLSWSDLWSATFTCKTWSKALAPLREGMLLLHWGKRFKHGQGVAKNVDKALESYTKGAVRGCAAAMVDTGLLLWELGRRDEGMKWYKQAAELRYPAGMCNLGLAYLQDLGNPVEAVKWFERAAEAGHVRAQYSLALCLQQGRGVECNLQKAAWWYLKAAEGGSSRAMYNSALCLQLGEGVPRNLHEAKHWMHRAAMAGHVKAQYEHGLTLFEEGEDKLALVFLELATRAGETEAELMRNVLLVQLSPKLRAYALSCADNFQNGNKWQR